MILPATMSGVYLTRHGGPEALEWCDDIPVPAPGPGQVLVRVLAAGVNNTDINTRIGWYSSDVTGATDSGETGEAGGWAGALHFPRIQGGDLCGRIVALGAGVTGWTTGQRVTCQINLPRPTPENPFGFIALGSELDGAFAEYCLLEANDLFDVTASPLSDVEIAATPCAYGTAWNLLARCGVAQGDAVLITGASGGVGLAAVQLATHLGARVTAMTAPAKADAVTAAGATAILGRDVTPPPARFDRVIDVVGGPLWPDLIRALKPGGHYAVSGAIAGPMVSADLRQIYLPDITLHGATYQPREIFARLIALINEGSIRPLVSATYPLNQIAEAQAEFMTKRLPGKIVLIPSQEQP
ncbi:alcohol dehydrogenase family protein [Ruegeria marina]|uniref:Alcohol dehydrogenase n=1 Tax=Ruegeria marina TaxID=639004 RepID=A0A1G6NU39_9RHOB|nr:alcohol dehydrogenase family protein [Ruegeria marina]SDC71141.1 alcohol dehydrogenase [Ruegeria marina]